MWAKESKHTIKQSSQAKLSCTKNVTSHLSRESRIFFFHIPSRNPETKKCELKNKPFICNSNKHQRTLVVTQVEIQLTPIVR